MADEVEKLWKITRKVTTVHRRWHVHSVSSWEWMKRGVPADGAFWIWYGNNGNLRSCVSNGGCRGNERFRWQPEVPTTKRQSYKDMKELTEKFQKKNGSVICREIKGVDTGKVLRSCDGCIADAVEFCRST